MCGFSLIIWQCLVGYIQLTGNQEVKHECQTTGTKYDVNTSLKEKSRSFGHRSPVVCSCSGRHRGHRGETWQLLRPTFAGVHACRLVSSPLTMMAICGDLQTSWYMMILNRGVGVTILWLHSFGGISFLGILRWMWVVHPEKGFFGLYLWNPQSPSAAPWPICIPPGRCTWSYFGTSWCWRKKAIAHLLHLLGSRECGSRGLNGVPGKL